MSACQCAACKQDFSCVTAFDKHQRPGDGSFGSVTCLDPAGIGLVRDRFGRWSWPQNAPRRVSGQILRGDQAAAGMTGRAG